MSNPKVTVLMTIYKDKSYLKEAVDSILNQTFQNFEFLIVNEFGYDDGSVDILKSYNDSRIRIIQNNVKKGFAASLNIGLAQARGEYIARMDGDDISAPDRLEKQVKYLDLHKNTGIVSCWYKFFGDLDKIYKGTSNDKRLKSNLIFFCDIAHGGSMFRKSLFDKYNLRYDESCPIEDHDLWSRASLCFDIHIIPQVLFYYRWDGNNISNNKYDLIQRSTVELVQRNLKVLNIEIPDNLKNVFNQSGSYFTTLDDADILILTEQLKQLFNEIEKNNSELKIFDKHCLYKTLCRKWRQLYNGNYKNKKLLYSSKYCDNMIKFIFNRFFYLTLKKK